MLFYPLFPLCWSEHHVMFVVLCVLYTKAEYNVYQVIELKN